VGHIGLTNRDNLSLEVLATHIFCSHFLCLLVSWRMAGNWMVSEVFMNAHTVEVKNNVSSLNQRFMQVQ